MLFQFKIQLKNVAEPTVWRRLTVPAGFNFYKFHQVIQCAFGWEDYHLFQFSPKGYTSALIISIPDSEFDYTGDDVKRLNAKRTKLQDIFIKEKQKYTYIYDFGDDWTHEIVLEKIIKENHKKADCVAGQGACPPEDCGGPWGYADLKEKLNDPEHSEHADMKEWLGLDEDETWDANDFNLAFTQEIVRSISRKDTKA